MTVKELAEGLKNVSSTARHIENVRMRCKAMDLTPKSARDYHNWTREEEDYLRKSYNRIGYDKMAAHLGLPKKKVTAKAEKMRLRYGEMERVTPWMDSMLVKIKDTGKTLYDLSIELFDMGRKVSVEENANGKLAVFSRVRNTVN